MLLRQLHIDLERALAGVMADLADDHRRLLHDLQACDVMVDALRYAACMTLTCGPHAHRIPYHGICDGGRPALRRMHDHHLRGPCTPHPTPRHM